MKLKRIISVFALIFILTSLFSIAASADTGPKPSVRITFENLGDELCFATLLSSTSSTGPASVWNGEDEYAMHNENPNGRYSYLSYGYDIWKAFVDYAENDGFYFLQELWQINKTKELAWTYYPPSKFKILLYFPESEKFMVSDVYERYAFDSYFTVDMSKSELSVDYNEEQSSDERINAYRSYNYAIEIISLVLRIIITIAIEIAIAFLFCFREKKQMLFLAGMNIATQIILNLLLNIINYSMGRGAFLLFYILFELIVVIIEAVLMLLFVNKLSAKPKRRLTMLVCVLISNIASFGLGLLLAEWIPTLF